MSDTITIRLSGPLRDFITKRTDKKGLYESASEYLRDLIRKDFEKEENRRWAFLEEHLAPALHADEDEYVPLNMADLVTQAREEYHAENA